MLKMQLFSLKYAIMPIMNTDAMQAVSQSLNQSLDRTILPVFRAFAIIRLGIYVLVFFLQANRIDYFGYGRALMFADIILLLVYLSVPYLQQKLGQYYLRIGLIWVSISPIMLQNLAVWEYFQNLDLSRTPFVRFIDVESLIIENVIDWVLLATIGQTIIVLLAPLIIISWRYSSNVINWFCIGTALLDLATSVIAIPLADNQVALLIGLVIFRTLLFAVIGRIINKLVELQKQQQQELLIANHNLQQYAQTREQLLVSQERNRLARELHDTLAHTLAATAVQLEAINVIWNNQPEKARDLLGQATTTTREGLEDTRRALQALRASPLETMGLSNAIDVLAHSLSERYPIKIETDMGYDQLSLTSEQEHTIYRIVQEALNNTVRHANATKATVGVVQADNSVKIVINDNGTGFDVASSMTKKGHFGLDGMQERAAHIGAKLIIESSPENGTTVTLEIGK